MHVRVPAVRMSQFAPTYQVMNLKLLPTTSAGKQDQGQRQHPCRKSYLILTFLIRSYLSPVYIVCNKLVNYGYHNQTIFAGRTRSN